jgi:hypothetical protein
LAIESLFFLSRKRSENLPDKQQAGQGLMDSQSKIKNANPKSQFYFVAFILQEVLIRNENQKIKKKTITPMKTGVTVSNYFFIYVIYVIYVTYGQLVVYP